MYWVREFQPFQIVAYILLSSFWSIGGWLHVSHLFPLKRHERLLTGVAAGWFVVIVITNLLSRLLPLGIAFAVSSFCIFATGILFYIIPSRKPIPWKDWLIWSQLLWLAGLTVILELIQRGLAIFDEYLHLPLVSILATGDIPPHFPVNPSMEFAYHYGIQLWAATIVRLANFTPWAAFDLAKSLSLAFTIILAWLWVRRWTRSGILAGLGSVLIVLGGGALWLLLLLPPNVALSLTSGTHLVNTAADSGSTIMKAMISPWITEGGGPFPFPFAYVNGIFMPVIIAYGSSASFPYLMVLWLLLIASKPRITGLGGIVIGLVLASLALVAEHLFALLWGSVALIVIFKLIHRKPNSWREIRPWLAALGLSALLSAVQGGYITVVLHNLQRTLQGVRMNSAYIEQFNLRWPPGIFSQKLGELSLFDPRQVVLLLLEIGPVVLVAPIVGYLTVRWLKRGNYLFAGLGITSFLCLLIPAFIKYSVDPSIARFAQTGLWIWLTLSIPGLIYWLYRAKGLGHTVLGLGALVTTFSGFVLIAIMFMAIQAPQFSTGITPNDVQASKAFWDRFAPREQVLGSIPNRIVTLFGRGTTANQSMYVSLDSYSSLVHLPDPQAVIRAGFTYVYMDKQWWDTLPPEIRNSYTQPCVRLLGNWQDAHGDFRRLYDISGCQ